MLKKVNKGTTPITSKTPPPEEEVKYDRTRKKVAPTDDADIEEDSEDELAAYRKRRKEAAAAREAADSAKYTKFMLMPDEVAVISFPLGFKPSTMLHELHSLKVGSDYPKVPCLKALGKKSCPYCLEKLPREFVTIPILDYRGSWDKDSKRFEGGLDKKDNWVLAEPVPKLWVLSAIQFDNILQVQSRKKKKMDDMLIEVSRVGKDKATTYNYSINSFDEIELVTLEDLPAEVVKQLPKPQEIFSIEIIYDNYAHS